MSFARDKFGVIALAACCAAVAAAPVAMAAAPSPMVQPAAASSPSAPVASDLAKHPGAVKSPMVGTFYRSAQPGSEAFASVGTKVREGDTLCIIEAMKLMNEINAEVDGVVVKCFVENGQAVQYGERLFAIKPA